MFKRKGLANLVGETIADVEVVDYDHLGDGERVDELYRISTTKGKQLYFLVDGGDCSHCGLIEPVTLDQDGKVEGRYDPEFAKYMGNFKSIKDNKE